MSKQKRQWGIFIGDAGLRTEPNNDGDALQRQHPYSSEKKKHESLIKLTSEVVTTSGGF